MHFICYLDQYLTSVEFPESLTEIYAGAFYNCENLSGELRFPRSLISIGKERYLEDITNPLEDLSCGLPDIIHPDDLEDYSLLGLFETGSFSYCTSLSGICFPDSLVDIGEGSFSGCTGLSGELRFPEKLEYIGDRAFTDCAGLSGELHLPEKLKYIGKQAFAGCTAIEKIFFYNRNTDIHEFLSAYDRPIICGYENSTAEKYARDHDLIFEKLT